VAGGAAICSRSPTHSCAIKQKWPAANTFSPHCRRFSQSIIIQTSPYEQEHTGGAEFIPNIGSMELDDYSSDEMTDNASKPLPPVHHATGAPATSCSAAVQPPAPRPRAPAAVHRPAPQQQEQVPQRGVGMVGPSAPQRRTAEEIKRKYGKGKSAASQAGEAAAVMNDNVRKLHERGERLSQIQDKTANMENDAKSFMEAAQQLAEREGNKKWWQW